MSQMQRKIYRFLILQLQFIRKCPDLSLDAHSTYTEYVAK